MSGETHEEPKPMTREEASVLLYLETCAVDHGGMVDRRRMNADDFRIAEQMQDAGLLRFGRMLMCAIREVGKHYPCSHWVELLEPGWENVAILRRRRAERNLMDKSWRTESKHAPTPAKEGTP